MAKKLILYGMEISKRQLRDWALGVVLLCYSLLLSPLYAHAEICTAGIDYNKPTITGTYYDTVGLKEDGTVVATGAGPYGGGWLNVSGWSNIKTIAAHTTHVVGLKEDGTVVATGWSYLGDPTMLYVSDWTNIRAIAAGNYSTLGLKEDGTVVAIGYNFSGQLNVSDWTNIKAIAAAGFYWVIYVPGEGRGRPEFYGHTVGLKEDGTVVATGNNEYGQLNVSDWINIKAIATGDFHTVGLKEDGTVVAAGWFGFGALNVSDWTNIRQPACANNPPVANAGPDQVIECAGPSGASVILNGSASSDPDGDPLTYTWTWAGGSVEGVSPTVSLPLGTTVVTLTVSDGKSTATDTVNITVQDKTPPVTTATGGSDNWYNTNVISSFSATDSCSGVKEIHYTVNGTETVVSGDSASLTLTTDGAYNIAYYSIDNAGNAEAPKSMTVKIDKIPPVLSLSTNPNILWPTNHKMESVLIGGNATDALSGIASVTFTVTDEYGTTQPSISSFNTAIQLEAWREGTDKDGRHYTITAVATDAAGNKTKASATVLVPHDQGN